MKDVIEVATEIHSKIHLLAKGRALLQERAEAKAKAIGEYYKAKAKVAMQLRQGVAFKLDGVNIKDPPISNVETLTRGICWREKIARDLAESEYTNAIKGLDSIKAELNGLQSVFKHLEGV